MTKNQGNARITVDQRINHLADSKDRLTIFIILGTGLAIWEIIVRLKQLPAYLLPAPTEIAQTLWVQRLYYARAAAITSLEALTGLAVGVGVGIAIATLITFWSSLEHGILALAILVKATPIVAIAPLLIIWLGFGPAPKIVITALMTFFPVLVNMHAGFHAVEPAVLELFHSLAASRWEVFTHARWPSSLPYLFAALRIVGPLSLIGAVVAEWAGASTGLGRAMWLAYTNLNIPALFAAVFCSATIGVVLSNLIAALERRVIFW